MKTRRANRQTGARAAGRVARLGSLLVLCSALGAEAANVLVTNYSADATVVRPLREAGGGMLDEGEGVVAVGSFLGMSDDEIEALAASEGGVEELSRRFVMHGNAMETGSGGAIAETGVFGNDASAPVLAGDPLAGAPVFTVVSTSGGLLVWKSDVVFPTDAPISAASASMADVEVGLLGSQLLVGGVGETVDSDWFGAGMVSVELAAVEGEFWIDEERIERFERRPEPEDEVEEPPVTVATEDDDGGEGEGGGGDPPDDPVDPPGVEIVVVPPLVPEDLVDVIDVIDGDDLVHLRVWLEEVRWMEQRFVVADAAVLDAVVLRGIAADHAMMMNAAFRAPVPEPGTVVLLGLGASLLLGRRRPVR